MASDLQVKTSPRPQSRVALEVVVPAERCQDSYDKVMRKLCRTMRLPGFRPGRIPKAAVLQQLGAREVWTAALEQLLEDTVQDVGSDEDLNLLGGLKLQDSFDDLAQRFNPSESIILNIEGDVHPSATLLKPYRDLEVEVEEASVEEILEKRLQAKRRSLGTKVPIERTIAQMGDVAVIQLAVPPSISKELKALEEKEGLLKDLSHISPTTPVDVDLVEDNNIMFDLVTMIVGMKVGETKEIPGTAKRYENDSATDQDGNIGDEDEPLSLSFTLLELKARQLPELDDDFAHNLMGDRTSLAELKDVLREIIKEEVEMDNKESKHDALLDLICKDIEVDLPQSMIDDEMEEILRESKNELRASGIDPDLALSEEVLEEFRNSNMEEAKRRLHHKLALETVAKEEEIIVTETELDVLINDMYKNVKGKKSRKQIDSYSGKLRSFAKRSVQRKKAMDWLERHNTFKMVRTATAEDREDVQSSPAFKEKATESTNG